MPPVIIAGAVAAGAAGAGASAAVVAGAAIAGGIAGAIGSKSNMEHAEASGVNLRDQSELEKGAEQGVGQSYASLANLTNAGPGTEDVSRAAGSSRDFASMLEEMSRTGGLPGQEDISRSNELATSLFAPQRLAQQNAFQDAMTQNNRTAAIMGRAANDPILQAKLQTENLRQRAMLEANQGSAATNIAMQLPGQRAQYAGQANDVRAGLATQAFRNRAALLEAGSGILSSERNWRLATSERYATSTDEKSEGGGVGGAITGAIGGAGAGMSMAGGMNSLIGNMGSGGSGSFGSQNIGQGYAPMNFSQPIAQQMPQFQAPQFGQSFNPRSARTFNLGGY